MRRVALGADPMQALLDEQVVEHARDALERIALSLEGRCDGVAELGLPAVLVARSHAEVSDEAAVLEPLERPLAPPVGGWIGPWRAQR